jgi:hypothetical protein
MLPMKPMTSEELQKNILSTYFTLRAGIVVLSAVLPVILYIYSWYAHGGLEEHSMSAFYGAYDGRLRNVFVGILWAVGSFLVLYKGFSIAEDWLLNFAGVFAILTAMTPCNCWLGLPDDQHSTLHSAFAIAFFACMALVCEFCARDTISLLPTKALQDKFKRIYHGIGLFLILSPIAAVAAAYMTKVPKSSVFFIEWFGVWVFAFYWLTKSREFRITSAEKRAVKGELKRVPGVGLVPASAPNNPHPPPPPAPHKPGSRPQ